ncbi:MAG: hypothetical protein JNK15_03110 [Planctomycetes bacterium]|nr:hypothetical protein [Planctomycetota bacterium]
MARDARTILVRADHHGELVTYRFRAGGTRQFLAVVNRLEKTGAAPGIEQISVLRAHVFVPRHATNGITQVTTGDRIDLAMRIGDEVTTARVEDVLSQDEGGFLLEVHA